MTRKELPTRRECWFQKASVGGFKVHLNAGEYQDGTLGEIFISSDLQVPSNVTGLDEDFRAMLNCFAMAISLGLQHGVPLETYIQAYVGTRFSVGGVVQGSEYIKLSSSVLDWIFRELAIHYLGWEDLASGGDESVGEDF